MKTRCILAILVMSSVLLFGMDAFAFYNPTTGRWLSRDPIGELGGNNLYSYADNQPISHVDPSGLMGTPKACCYCQSVKYSFKWGGENFTAIGRYDVNKLKRIGNVLHWEWTVAGDPSKCEYHQNEEGTVNSYVVGDGVSLTFKSAGDVHSVPTPYYDDHMGFYEERGFDNYGRTFPKARYHQVYSDFKIHLQCLGTDKKLAEKTITINGTFDFDFVP